MEIVLNDRNCIYRVVYRVQPGADLWVVHAFQKKSKKGIKTPKPYPGTDQASQGGTEMSDGDFDIIRGSGNVFRDFKRSPADADQLKAILAAQIIKVLDRRKLTVREAGEATGVAAADFSRIRSVNLARFTIDRLMAILDRLDQRIDVAVTVHPKKRGGQPASLR